MHMPCHANNFVNPSFSCKNSISRKFLRQNHGSTCCTVFCGNNEICCHNFFEIKSAKSTYLVQNYKVKCFHEIFPSSVSKIHVFPFRRENESYSTCEYMQLFMSRIYGSNILPKKKNCRKKVEHNLMMLRFWERLLEDILSCIRDCCGGSTAKKRVSKGLEGYTLVFNRAT